MQLKNLKTNFLGRDIIYYKEIDSTQNEIWRKIKNRTIKNGTLIISDIQTNGKGTHGRTWYTDENNNIAFSLFVEMNCNIRLLNGITIEIAKIIVNIFYTIYGIGINTHKEKFTEDIKNIATSIKKEFNIDVDRSVFIAEFCNKFEKELTKRIGN